MSAYDPVMSAAALAKLSGPVILFDARTGPKAREAYAAGHLPGARFADLETDLADHPADAAAGGRHPLPKIEHFARFLGAAGVTPEHAVVIYDDQGGMNAAARLWWMLRAVGHERVWVLDGGLSAALAAGLSLTTEPTVVRSAPPYPTSGYGLPMADIDQVDRLRLSPDHRVLDVRAGFRYRGESEPIDPIAGHIPGAINVPLTENLDGGRFKDKDALRALYEAAMGGVPAERLIVHCGSGVTACHTLLALERAGLTGARLYVGSWSEWCRQPERPREP